MTSTLDLDRLDFARGGGLVTVVAQDAATGVVLMVAHADREALERTLASGEMHYHSRRRGLWRKGGTSGNVQRVMSLEADCDNDAVLARVHPAGPACHTGALSCFSLTGPEPDALASLDAVVAARAAALAAAAGAPGAVPGHTARLLGDRNLRLKKLGEEAAELVVACVENDRARATSEAADLIYHALVALHGAGARWDDVRRELARRARGGPEA